MKAINVFIKDIFKGVDETSPEAFGIKPEKKNMYLGPLDNSSSESNAPKCAYKIGDVLTTKEASGSIDTIEWSTTFRTWCYRLVGKNPPYWVYEISNFFRLVGGQYPFSIVNRNLIHRSSKSERVDTPSVGVRDI